MEVIYNLSRKIKQRCDNWPLSTLSGFQVCKTNVASGLQYPVCCAFWCRFLLPGRWLGSHRWKKALRSITENDQVMSERGQQAAVVEVTPW